MNLSPMDYIRAAIANAQHERLTLADLAAMAEHATTCERFDNAVNVLVNATGANA